MFERYDQKVDVFAFYGRFHELLPMVLGFHGKIDVWEVWPKIWCFRVLWSFSWVIAHSFGLQGRFPTTVRPDTCLGDMTKKSMLLRFMVFSWVIAHSFGVKGRFTTTVRPDICLRASPRTRCFRVLWPFLWTIVHNFGVLGDLHGSQDPIHVWGLLPKTRHFSVFWPYAWVISHSIRVPRRFTYLRGMMKILLFLLVMVVSMSDWPQFWGSRAIYNNRKAWYMFARYDQKVVVFLSYCPQFWGSRRIAWPVRPDTWFRVMNKKLVISVFYDHFHELLRTVLEL